MTLKRRKVEAALKRKGFEKGEGRHSYFIYHTRQGVKTSVWTMTSHGSSGADISDPLIALMARQCRISKKKFEQLVDCSLSQEEYEELLVEKNVIHVAK